jgi:hypothetical protein
VIDADAGLAAAGGWSKRDTLFGGDQAQRARGPAARPATEPARIRAFLRASGLGAPRIGYADRRGLRRRGQSGGLPPYGAGRDVAPASPSTAPAGSQSTRPSSRRRRTASDSRSSGWPATSKRALI